MSSGLCPGQGAQPRSRFSPGWPPDPPCSELHRRRRKEGQNCGGALWTLPTPQTVHEDRGLGGWGEGDGQNLDPTSFKTGFGAGEVK